MHDDVPGRRTPAKHDGQVDYLLLSDVHLGSDIVTHLRPWAATSWLLQEAQVDARLVSMLDHHRTHHQPGRRWRLIFAGDFLDLVGVSLTPRGPTVRTPPNAEELLHGLGSAPDHVVHKLEAIAARHPGVFAALARFVAAGHSLVIVRGNHDIELHWRAAQRALIDAILAHAPVDERHVLAARIEICPWFYAVEGLLYVEHGHEFDAMCSYGDPLMPTCVRDPRRIRSTPFSVLLRHVARPTRGLSSASYGYVGMGAYMILLARLGLLGSLQIAVRYARASSRLLRECFARAVDGGRARVRRARLLLQRFAAQTGVSEARLHSLRALYVAPAVHSVDTIVRKLYLDRIACVLLTVAWVLGALVSGFAIAALLALIPLAYACIGRGSNVMPKASMRDGAARIAPMFDARWVVMGHTHVPTIEQLEGEASYVNLGSWGQDDPPEEQTGTHQSSCTYLTIKKLGGQYRAELLRWDLTRGAAPMHAPPSDPAPQRFISPNTFDSSNAGVTSS